jgi:hypothetical protein
MSCSEEDKQNIITELKTILDILNDINRPGYNKKKGGEEISEKLTKFVKMECWPNLTSEYKMASGDINRLIVNLNEVTNRIKNEKLIGRVLIDDCIEKLNYLVKFLKSPRTKSKSKNTGNTYKSKSKSKSKSKDKKYFNLSTIDNADVKKEYYRLSKIYHPDKCPNDESRKTGIDTPDACTEAMKKIGSEYDAFKIKLGFNGGKSQKRNKTRRHRRKSVRRH